MGRVLILTEKPSVAGSIAAVLNVKDKKDGYYSGNGYLISFAFGHLFQLYDAKDYNSIYQTWDVANLPIIPAEFKYKLIDDPGVKKQFKIIGELANYPDVDMIINAADSDREGELLATEIISALHTSKPVKRLWLSSHTPEAIKNGLAQLKTNAEMIPLQAAGYSRQWIDWLIGINYTVATTKLYGQGQVLKVGRVILPTLKLLYDRERAIQNFKPEPYYELQAVFESGNQFYFGLFRAQGNTKHLNKELLAKVQRAIHNQPGKVIKKDIKRVFETAPRLFNLTDLQGYITSHYQGYSAAKVLKIAQTLYENRFITYPRTASRHLDDTQKGSARQVLAAVQHLFTGQAVQFKDSKDIFDSSKVDSHPAIIPTYIIPKDHELPLAEKTVYLEIVKRFMARFMPPAQYDEIEMLTEVNNYEFLSKGKSLVVEGWRSLYPKGKDNRETPANIGVGALAAVTRSEILSKKSEPPQRYTEATLLKRMENISNKQKDDPGGEPLEDDLIKILQGFSLGTAATRGDILQKIIRTGYAELKGKSFFISKLGSELIELFPLKEYLNPEYTGQMEQKLKEIELGQLTKNSLLQEIILAVRQGIERMKGVTAKIPPESPAKQTSGLCPECGREVVENSKAYGCSGYRAG